MIKIAISQSAFEAKSPKRCRSAASRDKPMNAKHELIRKLGKARFARHLAAESVCCRWHRFGVRQ